MSLRHTALLTSWSLLGALCLACGSGGNGNPAGGSGAGGKPSETPPDGVSVALTVPADLTQARQAALAPVTSVKDLDAAGLAARYPVKQVSSLGYDPGTAAGLDLITKSSVAPSAEELAILKKNGFVISDAHRFPTFAYGYSALYAADLPLFVSADSILDAVHRSYDKILEQIEEQALVPELRTLLVSLRTKLGTASTVDAGARADVDFYLAVALNLLNDAAASPVAGANAADIQSFVSKARAASGAEKTQIFGVPRDIDFSQFTPRGHYTDTPTLSQYFRAMMWLGRIDLRLIETQPDGSQQFYRRQFDAMLALSSLFDDSARARHEGIDAVIRAFVGESDNMTPSEVPKLLAKLGENPSAATGPETDAVIAQAILDGGFGMELIDSDIMFNDGTTATLPLHRTFLLFGQRYVPDSHVLSNVVYDRVASMRMMPDPLDAAFAALKNDQAGALLGSELAKYEYASNLAGMRELLDSKGDDFWQKNLYTLWLGSLRALSPAADTGNPAGAGLPAIIGTEPWGRRILNTQLGSWAELRHDTILYAKQSYTGGTSCEFPDAYVDPYPEFFAGLAKFADHATEKVIPVVKRVNPSIGDSMTVYFSSLRSAVGTLGDMAKYERAGTPFTADQMAFINQAVTLQRVCGSDYADGWYPKLVYGDSLEFDPTIADVHTQPSDENGNIVGRVLHVGTGHARTLLMTRDTCMGPRAYAGLVFSYHEKITDDFTRLDDIKWKDSISSTSPDDVPWMRDLVVR
jgi:hypothetical protein